MNIKKLCVVLMIFGAQSLNIQSATAFTPEQRDYDDDQLQAALLESKQMKDEKKDRLDKFGTPLSDDDALKAVVEAVGMVPCAGTEQETAEARRRIQATPVVTPVAAEQQPPRTFFSNPKKVLIVAATLFVVACLAKKFFWS